MPNHFAVLAALHAERSLSRPQLAHRTGLSRPTVTLVVEDLLTRGMLEETEPAAGRRATGRPPRLLTLAPRSAYAIGVEFERDHVGWVLCDLHGAPVAGGRRAIDPDAGAARSVRLVAGLVDRGLQAAGV